MSRPLRTPLRPSPIFLGIVLATIAAGALCLVPNRFAATAGVLLMVLGGWVISVCLHEFGHAVVAYRGGDYSVRAKGYLNLDPRRYTDPVLSIVLPIIFLLIGGLPLAGAAVWLNPGMLRSRGWRTGVSLAGPAVNLVFGLLLSLVVVFASADPTATLVSAFSVQQGGPAIEPAAVLLSGIACLAFLQILAFVLNMLPVPGLDGWGAIEPYLPWNAQQFGRKAMPWAPLILLALLILPNSPVATAFFAVTDALFGLLGGDPDLARVGLSYVLFWQQL